MKICLVCLLSTVMFSLSICIGQTQSQVPDILYLKNGSIIKGEIVELVPDKTVKIQTADGSIFAYAMAEVEKITMGQKARLDEPNEQALQPSSTRSGIGNNLLGRISISTREIDNDTMKESASFQATTILSFSTGYGFGMSTDHAYSYNVVSRYPVVSGAPLDDYNGVEKFNMSLGRGFKADACLTLYPFQHLGFIFGFGYSKMGELVMVGNWRSIYSRTDSTTYARTTKISCNYFPFRLGISLETKSGNFNPYANVSFYYAIINSYDDKSSYSDYSTSQSPNTTFGTSTYSVDFENGIGIEWSIGIRYTKTANYGLDLSISSISATAKVNNTEYKSTNNTGTYIDRTIYTGTESGSYTDTQTHTSGLDTYTYYQLGNPYYSFDALVLKAGIYYAFR